MNHIEINGALLLPCPEGFAAMTQETLQQVYTCDNPCRAGIWDRARHVMVTVLWQRYNPLLAAFADMKTLVRRNEQLTRKGYKDNDYRLDTFFSRRICDLPGEGYRFDYRLGDVAQQIETVLFKKGSVVYSLSCIGRPENRQENRVLYDAILDGMRLK